MPGPGRVRKMLRKYREDVAAVKAGAPARRHTTFRLSFHARELLRIEAEFNGVSMTAMLERMIREWNDERGHV